MNTLIDFEIVSANPMGKEYVLAYRAEVEHLTDGYAYRKGEKHYYEGTIRFTKEGKSWIPQSAKIFGHECEH